MEIKILTYNIDGLPDKLDLMDLPWFLRPVAWIYRLIKKTTKVTINDNGNRNDSMALIGRYLKESGAGLIGVQEDFNYHGVYTDPYLKGYTQGIHQGGFDLSKGVRWLPYPRFSVDGLCLFAKNGKVRIKEEKAVSWEKSNGYFSHANDKLTTKGFRFYVITVEDKVDLDVYLVHMDADFYHPDNCPDVSKDVKARASQLRQLSDYIIDRYASGFVNPVIIMGDTNSCPDYEWDEKNIEENLFKPVKRIPLLGIQEVVPDNAKDVDRIFIINNACSGYVVIPKSCSYGIEMGKSTGKPSDHWPLSAVFSIRSILTV